MNEETPTKEPISPSDNPEEKPKKKRATATKRTTKAAAPKKTASTEAKPRAPRKRKAAVADAESVQTDQATEVTPSVPEPASPPAGGREMREAREGENQTPAVQADAAPVPATGEQVAPPEHTDQARPRPDASSQGVISQGAPASPGEENANGDRRENRFRKRFRNRRRGRFRDDGPAQNFEDSYHKPDDGSPLPEEEEVPMPEDYVPVYEEGIVEVSGKGFGFLRDARCNFTQSKSDTFVTPEVVRRHNLRDGMWIKGEVRRGNRGPQLFKLTELEGEDPANFQNLPVFEELTTINPLERLRLETTPDRFTTRIIDMMAPIGKGQRGLLVAPPRTGKTTLLQHIAEGIRQNYPEIKLMILLVDERPEEVTEIRRALPEAELFASSNDDDTKSHTRIAQLAVERARRLVEMGKDVFLLLDSLTRVGRAFNNSQQGGGRTMSGGVDSRALEIPRRLFASARNTEEAGSLTIIATALIETGSKMDELIFLEFKGTGNMELVLDRRISDQRIYPAADIFQSGTRREELLLPADDLQKISVIRRGLAGHKPMEAIERMLFFMKKYPTNAEMLANIPTT